jgi:hypothetical protein
VIVYSYTMCKLGKSEVKARRGRGVESSRRAGSALGSCWRRRGLDLELPRKWHPKTRVAVRQNLLCRSLQASKLRAFGQGVFGILRRAVHRKLCGACCGEFGDYGKMVVVRRGVSVSICICIQHHHTPARQCLFQ